MDHRPFEIPLQREGGRPDPRRAGFQGLTGIEQGGGQSKTAPVTGTRPNLQ